MALTMSALFAMPALAMGYDVDVDQSYTMTLTESDRIAPALSSKLSGDDTGGIGTGYGLAYRIYSGHVMLAYLDTVSDYPDHPVPAMLPAPITITNKVPI